MFCKRGFTLFETLMYIGIAGMILASMSVFVLQLMNARVKVQTSSQVLYSARLFEDKLSDAMRHAKSVNVGTSVFDLDPGVLSLQMQDSAKDPTIFKLDQDNGKLQVSEHGGAYVYLTAQNISVKNLVFHNLTTPKDKGVVQVQFDLSAINSSHSPFYQYDKSFQTSFRIPFP